MRNTTRRSMTRWTALLVGFASLGMIAAAQCNQNCPERRTISVSGTARVTTDADMAIVHVGYKLYGPDAKTSYANALDTSNAIMQALTGSGIPKDAIESTSQVLERTPVYELQPYQMKADERQQRQFMVAQNWTLRVKPDQASGALNTAITAGANESGWIQWVVNKPSAFEAQASAEAVENARAIAEKIAQESGVHLGQLVSVSRNQGPMPYGVFGAVAGSFGMGDAISFNGPMQAANQQLAINSRRVEFTVTVYAVYSIE